MPRITAGLQPHDKISTNIEKQKEIIRQKCILRQKE